MAGARGLDLERARCLEIIIKAIIIRVSGKIAQKCWSASYTFIFTLPVLYVAISKNTIDLSRVV
jgi:hypothetical protein